jgi:hypothetical protein
MWKMITGAAVTAAVVVLLAPSRVDGYGAAHFGYTRIGPNGFYHTGGTAGYRGAYGGRTAAYGYGPAFRGGGYWAGIAAGEAGVAQTHWAAATSDYTYVPSYYGPYYGPYYPPDYGPFYGPDYGPYYGHIR